MRCTRRKHVGQNVYTVRAAKGQCYVAGNGAVVHVSEPGKPCECSQRAFINNEQRVTLNRVVIT